MLNENIHAFRKKKGLSQEELAIRLNVVRQTVSKWETGISVPDAEMLVEIAGALDTTVNALLGETIPQEEDARETLASLSGKLEALNEQIALKAERNRRIGRTVSVLLLLLAAGWFLQEIFSWIQHRQFTAMLDSSVSIIGGADGPTSILVTSRTRAFSLILSSLAVIAAGFGLWRTRRKS